MITTFVLFTILTFLIVLAPKTAPSPTPRVAPTARQLPEGYQALITFAANTSIEFFEMTIKPPGMDGGEPIKTTTQFNLTYHTKAPQHLIDMEPFETTVAYDPDVIPQIRALINVPTTVTIRYPSSDTDCFYGWMKSFKPGDLKIGEMPTATIEVVPSNYDASGHVEAGPVYTPASGT